jgi:long-chain fatty acid transport protein
LLLSILIGLVRADPSQASGFAVREQSATALGNAFAGGAAAAEDGSYMFFNPAALGLQNGNQFVGVATYIRPAFKFKVKDASTAAGVSIMGGNGGGDVTDDHVVPSFFAVLDGGRIDERLDRFRIGLAATAPFGLESDYGNGWSGRYHALQTKLQTVNLAPTLAWNVIDGLSLAGGLQAQYAKAELSNAIDFGSLGAAIPALAPFSIPTEQDGRARVQGSDWGFGWTLGALYEPWRGTRVGLGYRSSVRHKLKGQARFRLDKDGIGAAISSATGAFQKTGATAVIDTPERLTFGIYHELDDRWALMADAAWTRWSRFDELRVKFDNPAQPDAVTDTDWHDTVFLAAGVTFRPAPPWAVRAGFAYDESPVPNRTRTPRIPDNDRYWLSFGASYQPSQNVNLSLGYAHIFIPDASVHLKADAPGNAASGNLSGNVDASIDIIGLQLRMTF